MDHSENCKMVYILEGKALNCDKDCQMYNIVGKCGDGSGDSHAQGIVLVNDWIYQQVGDIEPCRCGPLMKQLASDPWSFKSHCGASTACLCFL